MMGTKVVDSYANDYVQLISLSDADGSVTTVTTLADGRLSSMAKREKLRGKTLVTGVGKKRSQFELKCTLGGQPVAVRPQGRDFVKEARRKHPLFVPEN